MKLRLRACAAPWSRPMEPLHGAVLCQVVQVRAKVLNKDGPTSVTKQNKPTEKDYNYI